MSSMSFEEVSKMIRSCIVTEKKGMPLKMLRRQFYELVGASIPFHQLGFFTLEDLLKNIPGLRKEGFNQEGDIVLSIDASFSGMSHIQDMVKRQQNKQSKNRSACKYVVSRGAPMQRRSYFTPRIPQHSFASPSRPAYGFTPFNNFEKGRFNTTTPTSTSSFGQAPPYRSAPQPFHTSAQQPRLSSSAPQTKQEPSQAFKPPKMPNLADEKMPWDSQQVPAILEQFVGKENFEPPLQTIIRNCSTQHMCIKPTVDECDSDLLDTSAVRYAKEEISDVGDTPFSQITSMSQSKSIGSHCLKEQIISSPQMKLNSSILSQKLPRTSDPTVKNHQLIGDDYLLYFAFRNLGGKIVSDPLSCGLCHSGTTIQEALLVVRLNAVNISQKVIILLGHNDILGENYEAAKSKWYMTLLLEELSNMGIDVKILTLPHLYPHNAVVSKRIADFNDWLCHLHDPARFTSVLDLANVFNQLPLPTFYKSKKHYPAEKKVAIPMWSRIARSKVYAYLKVNLK